MQQHATTLHLTEPEWRLMRSLPASDAPYLRGATWDESRRILKFSDEWKATVTASQISRAQWEYPGEDYIESFRESFHGSFGPKIMGVRFSKTQREHGLGGHAKVCQVKLTDQLCWCRLQTELGWLWRQEGGKKVCYDVFTGERIGL